MTAINSFEDLPIRPREDREGWTFRYRAPDGSRPRVTRPTLIEALVAWLELDLRYVIAPVEDLESEPESSGPTLRQFFNEVYCVKHLPLLSTACAKGYRRYFELHIDPVLGEIPIDLIGTKLIS